MADQQRGGRDRKEQAPQHWRDRPVEEEADKDLKEGGMEQEQEQQRPAAPRQPKR